ncbi:MAG: methylenetetrahydrofolate--tRNA-(uracil(54)-C(5))-methyltransferase (FADH(2)-oxidizing) TrmFO [Syntrophales bacterium]
MKCKPVIIIGGGLAGCEAAWQIVKRGMSATLFEMKPKRFSPAHKSPHLSELVCSNSFRSNNILDAVGLLKEEMRLLGSLILRAADETAVPAGKALAVDRELFSRRVEDLLLSTEGLEIMREEATEIPSGSTVIVATGPLTSDTLAANIAGMLGRNYLYFYDAISPIVEACSIDPKKTFRASRYMTGEGDYLNCPMDKTRYESFWKALREARETPARDFENARYFESCLPIEVMAMRGMETLLFGPMKPVGLIDPATGRQPYAVVQLRQENREATLFNMVGFQTRLAWPEQKRIFRMIPGLENAEFARYGSIHRNTFIKSPALLQPTLQLRSSGRIFFAGQITGVEGYMESAATGIIAGINALRHASGRETVSPPQSTAIGSLLKYITAAESENFQPMNVNFGLFPPLEKKLPRKLRSQAYAQRALADMKEWIEKISAES